jgi:endogenous inhibitor of DNA gyrase (YacG/DUF329 family)
MSAPRARCPTCGRAIAWSDAFPDRPFCSERCKMVDLGAWLSETHRIAGEEVPSDADSGEDSRPLQADRQRG